MYSVVLRKSYHHFTASTFPCFRYGTLPKGARIGAYLESLKVSGLVPEQPPSFSSDQESDSATANSAVDNVSSSAQGTLERTLDQAPSPKGLHQLMMRSNSSHGGFGAGGGGGASRYEEAFELLPNHQRWYAQRKLSWNI